MVISNVVTNNDFERSILIDKVEIKNPEKVKNRKNILYIFLYFLYFLREKTYTNLQ